MRATVMTLIAALLLAGAPSSRAADDVPDYAQVVLETTEGNILIELDGRRAPLTVANFLRLLDDGYYDGTIFHRVMPGFVVQAGGYDRDLKAKEPEGGIPNESGNGLINLRGTVALARENDPHTGMAQFYINVTDNKSLNPRPDRWGYAVFGYVIEGMEVVDRIAEARTAPAGQFESDVPIAPIIIKRAYRQ